MKQEIWRFGEFELDRARFVLLRAGQPAKLDPKPLELLFLLAERRGAVVSHAEALSAVWGADVFVDGESAIYTAIKKIRQALGDASLVQTVSRHGYRLLGQEPEEAVAAAMERLAILPLVNLSGDTAQDYFSDGLTEELISTTARLFRGQLGVIARTSVMKFKSVAGSIEGIAAELGAQYVVEGSVRRHDSRVRIAVQLFRAADNASLWSETYERAGEDVFALQTEIALATAGAIRKTLQAAPEPEARKTVDAEVHDLFLRARHLWVQRTRPTLEAGMQYFRDAIQRDSRFAPAYAGLSCCHAILPITTNASPGTCFPAADALAKQALKLDAMQSEAHVTLGLVEFWYRRNWAEALRWFSQAATLNPSDSSGAMFLAHVYSIQGHHARAQSAIDDALLIDPFSPIVGTHKGHFLYNAGRYTEAVVALDRVLEMAPHFWIAHLMRGKALASMGDTEAAIAAFDRSNEFGTGQTEAASFRIYTLAQAGQREKATAAWQELKQWHERKAVPPMHRALAQLGLGDVEGAKQAVEEGFKEHDVRLVFLAVETRWRGLGAAYPALLERLGLPPAA